MMRYKIDAFVGDVRRAYIVIDTQAPRSPGDPDAVDATGGVVLVTPEGGYIARYEDWPSALVHFTNMRARIVSHERLTEWPAPPATSTEIAAARWNALVASPRLRVLGTSGLGATRHQDGYAHFGLEAWTQHPEHRNAEGAAMLTEYADRMRQAPAATRQAVVNVEYGGWNDETHRYEGAHAHLVGGAEGVFAAWKDADGKVHLAAGDDGNWWHVCRFDAYWVPALIDALFRAAADPAPAKLQAE